MSMDVQEDFENWPPPTTFTEAVNRLREDMRDYQKAIEQDRQYLEVQLTRLMLLASPENRFKNGCGND